MTILEILEKKVVPWVEAHGVQRMVVADESADQHPLPEGMKVTRVKVKGKRVAVHGPRSHGHASNVIAVWPDAGLTEMRLPFIACMIGRNIDYQAGERIFSCTEGDFLIIPSRTPHLGGALKGPIAKDDILDVLAFSTWDNHRQCCLCHAMGGNYLVSNPGIVHLLELLFEEMTARRPGFERAATRIFQAMLILLCREFRSQNFFHSGVTRQDADSAEARIDPIQRVRQHVATHLNEVLTIDDACNRALMSRTQFTKRFREATGQSFVEYVTERRIEQAKVLLHETEWSLAVVAEFVGLHDTTRLLRIFNRYVGLSPSQYRRESRSPKGKKSRNEKT